MSEILLPIILGVFRFFIGLYELFGFLFEADFNLTDGLFTSKTLLAVRDRVRRRKEAPARIEGVELGKPLA